MTQKKKLDVQLVAATSFAAPADVDWEQDSAATDAEALVEFAGRACYETFDKPNPHTAGNEAYLRHILEVGHDALLEHATATLYIRGLSRAAGNELLRHRHLSFSQLSQRFVPAGEADVVVPDVIAEDEDLSRMFLAAVDEQRFVYEELLNALENNLAAEPNSLLRKKKARQAARAILPNATETRFVVTGNYRAWREFIAARASEHADIEIRELAVACLEILKKQAPALFDDFLISTLADGSVMATSPYAG
ncbi:MULTISPECIES: FAD-dependent thymidylate synthase [unclassified Corynebacterium]|uniref:FAD-dependent thymidylate synthase n=1 Tax=unclassified Corynebacterium TaxID=2624378 RepID=UPI0021AA7DD3|nr:MULTISPECIES: FAD-dependent thymidylate synthase [unclassified Corynebacterium]MCT1451347.1 FAD-dependent thymidylate synthase [Corynebacterium sp. p3-SID1145]MCT1460645.1 FAD-dependent thymidylate synthase [Corynebacterium sp. p3-SID1140]MDN8593753.1 FAD-dependent thymidylate synthase [Corynebacterium sp. P4_F2]WKK55867.1 FAD-dependent thymidylate synthase [Corynebacterium sp. P4-C1]WKK63275.1 FAD-dependent thymidylate synthase [Corynebacterium sp. P8-C1]